MVPDRPALAAAPVTLPAALLLAAAGADRGRAGRTDEHLTLRNDFPTVLLQTHNIG